MLLKMQIFLFEWNLYIVLAANTKLAVLENFIG